MRVCALCGQEVRYRIHNLQVLIWTHRHACESACIVRWCCSYSFSCSALCACCSHRETLNLHQTGETAGPIGTVGSALALRVPECSRCVLSSVGTLSITAAAGSVTSTLPKRFFGLSENHCSHQVPGMHEKATMESEGAGVAAHVTSISATVLIPLKAMSQVGALSAHYALTWPCSCFGLAGFLHKLVYLPTDCSFV